MDFDIKNYQYWVGFDLDGTLAFYDYWRGASHIGKIIPRAKLLLIEEIRNGRIYNYTVKIFTARSTIPEHKQYVEQWLKDNGLPDLEVTNIKDYGMRKLYDDRAIQVIKNTGEIINELNPSDK